MTEGPEYEDVTMSSADIMTAKDSHGCVRETYRPMRGQAYVQMIDRRSRIIMPDRSEEEEAREGHLGRVFALGPPARLTDHPDSPLVPWHVQVGDEVVFQLFVWLDKMRTMRLLGVDGPVMVVAQGELIAVVDR